MGPFTAFKTCMRKYFTFSGRASWSEYWGFILIIVLVQVLNYLVIFQAAAGYPGLKTAEAIEQNPVLFASLMAPFLLFSFVVYIPYLSATVRRLHDVGRSGILLLLSMLPGIILAVLMIPGDAVTPMLGLLMLPISLVALVCGLLVLIFTLLPGSPNSNNYGPPHGAKARRQQIEDVTTNPEYQAARKDEISDYYKSVVMKSQGT